MLGHEVDRLRRDELGREDQIAFVLAILLVHQDDHAAALDIPDDLGGAASSHSCLPSLEKPRIEQTGGSIVSY